MALAFILFFTFFSSLIKYYKWPPKNTAKKVIFEQVNSKMLCGCECDFATGRRCFYKSKKNKNWTFYWREYKVQPFSLPSFQTSQNLTSIVKFSWTNNRRGSRTRGHNWVMRPVLLLVIMLSVAAPKWRLFPKLLTHDLQ